MYIERTDTVRTYYVKDGLVRYKVVHQTWSPEPEWRKGQDKDGKWTVFSSQGIHTYARQCDPTKATHQRVVEAVRKNLVKDGESNVVA